MVENTIDSIDHERKENTFTIVQTRSFPRAAQMLLAFFLYEDSSTSTASHPLGQTAS